MLGVDAGEAVLVDDEDALAVADVELCRRHGIVRSAIGVAAESLQLADAPCHQCLGQGSPHAGVVLVHVHSLQLQRLAVEQEAAVDIELHVAEAGGGLVDVGHLAVHGDGGLHLI